MQREIILPNEKIVYDLKKSRRARRVRLSISCEAGVRLTIPWWASEKIGEDFMRQKIGWILEKIKFFQNKKLILTHSSHRDYLKHKETARELAEKRLEYFNGVYNFSWNKISIRNTKSHWGSCSEKGNLNFSYRLINLPKDLQDYVIVHELCHLGELNHSARFWSLVGRTIPDYRLMRKKLKNF